MGAESYLTQPVSEDAPAIGIEVINYGGGNHTPTRRVRGVLITTAGALNVIMADGTTGIIPSIPTGQFALEIRTIVQASSAAAGVFLF